MIYKSVFTSFFTLYSYQYSIMLTAFFVKQDFHTLNRKERCWRRKIEHKLIATKQRYQHVFVFWRFLLIGNVVTFWTTTKIESIFTRWRWQPFLFTQNYSILHIKKLFEDTRTEVKYKKFTKIIVTEEVFFLARSIHNWQLFVAPHICARRIICGAQIKSMYLPQNLLDATKR